MQVHVMLNKIPREEEAVGEARKEEEEQAPEGVHCLAEAEACKEKAPAEARRSPVEEEEDRILKEDFELEDEALDQAAAECYLLILENIMREEEEFEASRNEEQEADELAEEEGQNVKDEQIYYASHTCR